MAGFFDTAVKPMDVSKLSELSKTTSKSPLSALGESMSKLDNILDVRVKDKYTESVMPKLEGVKSTADILGTNIDVGKLSDEGKLQYKNLSDLVKQNETAYLNQAKLNATISNPARRDALKQMTDAFNLSNPNATLEERQEFNKKALQKLTEGSGSVKETTDLDELDKNYKETQEFKKLYLNNPGDVKLTDMGQLARIENENFKKLNEKQTGALKDTIGDMKNNYVVVSNIDTALDVEKQEPITKGVIDNTLTYLAGITGIEAQQAYRNVDFTTRAGRILASYIKSTSGTAASDKEREFIQRLMLGGPLDDQSYVLRALNEFRESVADENDVLAGTIFNQAPSSATKYRKYKTVKQNSDIISIRDRKTGEVKNWNTKTQEFVK